MAAARPAPSPAPAFEIAAGRRVATRAREHCGAVASTCTRAPCRLCSDASRCASRSANLERFWQWIGYVPHSHPWFLIYVRLDEGPLAGDPHRRRARQLAAKGTGSQILCGRGADDCGQLRHSEFRPSVDDQLWSQVVGPTRRAEPAGLVGGPTLEYYRDKRCPTSLQDERCARQSRKLHRGRLSRGLAPGPVRVNRSLRVIATALRNSP